MEWPSRKQATTFLLLLFSINNKRKRKSLKPNNSRTRPRRANWKACSESPGCQRLEDAWRFPHNVKNPVASGKKEKKYLKLNNSGFKPRRGYWKAFSESSHCQLSKDT